MYGNFKIETFMKHLFIILWCISSVTLPLYCQEEEEDEDSLAFGMEENFIDIVRPAPREEIVFGTTYEIQWETRSFALFSDTVEIEIFTARGETVDVFKVENTGTYLLDIIYEKGGYFLTISDTSAEEEITATSQIFYVVRKGEGGAHGIVQTVTERIQGPFSVMLSLLDLAPSAQIKGKSKSKSYGIKSSFSLIFEKLFEIKPKFEIGMGISFQGPAGLKDHDGRFFFYSGYGTLRYTFYQETISAYFKMNFGFNYFNGDSDFKEDFWNDLNADIGDGFGTGNQLRYHILIGGGVTIKKEFLVEISYSINTGNISFPDESSIDTYVMNYSKIRISVGYLF